MEKTEIIYLAITLVSALFGVIMWVRKPQEKAETNDAVFDNEIKHLKEDTEKKFIEMVNGFNKSIELALNHSHTVEVKIDSHIKESQTKGENDARWQGRIETLLEERLPKK
jgi:hypothetical protein